MLKLCIIETKQINQFYRAHKMSNNMFVYPRKMLKHFLTMYRELPCLWDKTCVGYKQKQKRHEAISKLTALVKEWDPTATRVHVLRKIESLRSCVRREHKRVQDSKRKARSDDEIYTPHLWYYDMLSFVFDGDAVSCRPKTSASCSELGEACVEDTDDCANNISEEEKPCFEQPVTSYPEYNVTSSMVNLPVNPGLKRLTYDEDHISSNKRLCTETEDEYDAIGINVAAKLRNLPSSMRILAEKLINDVLYQAQTNSLNSSSHISTTDPFKPIII